MNRVDPHWSEQFEDKAARIRTILQCNKKFINSKAKIQIYRISLKNEEITDGMTY